MVPFRSANVLHVILLLTLSGFGSESEAANVAINNRTVEDWLVVDLRGSNTYKPLFINNHSVVPHDDVSHWPVDTYFWQAPEPYYQWKIYTYGGDLKFLVNHVVTRGDTSGKYLDEPDLVLEGGPREQQLKIGYRLPKEEDMLKGYDKNQTVVMPLTEPGWFYLNEQEDESGSKRLKLGDIPVSRADFSLVLAGLDRSLIRAKYHMDQVEGNLFDVNMHLLNNKSRTVECDNDCSGVLLDDLDDIDLLFDEIRRLAPFLKDGPWRRLAYLNARANNLTEALRHYLKLIDLGKEVIENNVLNFDPEVLADILELRAQNLNGLAPNVLTEAYQARLLAEKMLEKLLKDLWDRIRKTLKLLNEHGFGSNGVSPSKIERIVQESEMILRELRNRNLKPYLDDAERELRRAKQLLDKIKTLLIDPEKSAELLKRLEQLHRVLVDFSRIVQDQVLKPVAKANDLVSEGKKKYQSLLNLLKESEDRAKESQNALDEAKRMLDLTKKCLSDEALYLDQLPRQLIDLNNSIHEIEVKRSILTQVNPDYQKKYVDKCREHKDALVKKSQELDGLFNATRDVADYALRAANVYKNIKDAIDEAEKAAKRADEAAEKAYKVIVPDFDESLADKAREAKRKSIELLEKARKLRDQDVQRLKFELAKWKQTIDILLETVKGLADDLAKINAGLKQLADKNLFEQLQEIDAFLRRLLERIAEIHKRLQLLADIIYNSILPQYERLSAGSQSSLGNLTQVIDMARKDLMAAIKFASSSKLSLEKLLKLEAKLDLDLDMLRRKIQLAHHEATTIHVSIMPSSDTGVCTRSYFVPAIISSQDGGLSIGGFNIRNIVLTWSLHHEETESLLLFIGSKNGEDFLALEMYDRRIRLVYSSPSASSSGIHVLTHPKVIELNDHGLLNDETWYSINLSVDNDDQLRLSVKPHIGKVSSERDPNQVTQRLNPTGNSKLTITPFGEAEINFYVGGLPPSNEYSPPDQIKSNRLAGCLYDLSLNHQQVGLWNFKTNLGCQGCVEGPMEPRDTATFSFTGSQSYASVSQTKPYDRTRYMVSMGARTVDQNGLIFLSLSETTNHYMSIYISKGRIGLIIGKLSPHHLSYLGLSSSSMFEYAMASHIQRLTTNNSTNTTSQPVEHIILTEREYNTGQWFKITAEKDQNKLVLAVDNEYKESIVDNSLLTLDMDQVFFGGVWPIIKQSKFASTSLELNSFAGCLKDVLIETSPIDLLKRQSHGVETGCLVQHSSRSRLNQMPAARVAYPLPVGRR